MAILSNHTSEHNLPTPTEIVTDIGILAIAPKLLNNTPLIFLAVRLGMDLDDFYDFGVQPRPLGINSQPLSRAESQHAEKHYETYFDSYNKYRREVQGNPDQHRHTDNAGWFVGSIQHLEGKAISQPREYWNPTTVAAYRESVALVWALFMTSLNKKSSTHLYEVGMDNGRLSLEKCTQWMDDKRSCPENQTDKLYAQRMYYGALVFQVVSDYGKRKFGRDSYIPSFGGIGFEGFSEIELEKYIQTQKEKYLKGATESGVDSRVLSFFLQAFPQIQKTINMFKKSKTVFEWAYS